jgi:hypothetical protein
MHEKMTLRPPSLLSSQELGLNGSSNNKKMDLALKDSMNMLRRDAVPGGQAAEDAVFRDMVEWETYCADSAHIPLVPFDPPDIFAEIDALIGLNSALFPALELPKASTSSQRPAVSKSRNCANKPVRQTIVPSVRFGVDGYFFVGNWDGEGAAFQAFIDKVESRFMTEESHRTV